MTDWLENLRQGEDQNFAIARDRLGDTFSLVQDLNDLYDWFAGRIAERGPSVTPATVPGIYLFRGSQNMLNAGVIDCLRCHLTESSANTRVAIECVAFTSRISRHPHLGREWIEAGASDEAYDKYRRKFSGSSIFPKDEPDLEELSKRYDLCAKLGHPSFISFARRLEFNPKAPGSSKFHVFDVREGNGAEPVRTFLWIVDTHATILDVYHRVFAAVVKNDQAGWDVRRNGLEAKLHLHSAKWLPVISQLTPTETQPERPQPVTEKGAR